MFLRDRITVNIHPKYMFEIRINGTEADILMVGSIKRKTTAQRPSKNQCFERTSNIHLFSQFLMSHAPLCFFTKLTFLYFSAFLYMQSLVKDLGYFESVGSTNVKSSRPEVLYKKINIFQNSQEKACVGVHEFSGLSSATCVYLSILRKF